MQELLDRIERLKEQGIAIEFDENMSVDMFEMFLDQIEEMVESGEIEELVDGN